MRLVAIFFAIFLNGCGDTILQPVEKSREIVILTRVGITTYAENGISGMAGFEHDLARKFAEERGMKSRIVVAATDQDLFGRLKRGEAHLAIAWAPVGTDPQIASSRPYIQSGDVIVTHEASLPITQLGQLAGRTIHVTAGSRQEGELVELAKRIPGLSVVPFPHGNELDLMEGVASQRFEAALVSDAAFDIGSNFYPELQDSLELGPDRPIGWLLSEALSDELRGKANEFIERMESSGELARLKDRYFGHINRLTANDSALFIGRMRNVLPLYRPHFQEAQIRTGIDWRVLAALAYQESRWEPLATSPTGVRGMMMLTADTADYLGINNRLDPVQSIRAGADYLSELHDTLPEHIRNPDRLWLALAAYNLGMGHLNGARYLAKTLGADPDSWYEMKRVLPLIAKPQYYRRLKSGKGRGGEAVIMTENIRIYADILNRFEPPYEPMKRKSEKFIWKSFQARPDTDAMLGAP